MYPIKSQNKSIYPLILNCCKPKSKKRIYNLNPNGQTDLSIRFGSIHVHFVINIKKILNNALDLQNKANKLKRTLKPTYPE